MAIRLGLFKQIAYPVIRNCFYVFCTLLPYAPVRRLKRPPNIGEVSRIWAPTHSNFLCDITATAMDGKYPPKYIAKHTLFIFPIEGFVRFCGAVPVVRAEDSGKGGRDRTQNRSTFRYVIAAMQEGWSVGIFPEGMSIPAPGLLLPLKPGVAKLALAAEESSGFKLGLEIVPMGIEYGDRARVGSGITVRYGKPILVKEYKNIFEQDESLAVKAIMERLTNELLENFPHFSTWEEYRIGHRLWWSGVSNSKCQASQLLRKMPLADKTIFLERFLQFSRKSRAHGLPLWAWGSQRQWRELSLLQRTLQSFLLLAGVPALLWYLVHNFLANFAIVKITSGISADETELMTKRIGISPLVLAIFYGLQFHLFHHYFGLNFALYAVISILDWYFIQRWRNIFWRIWGFTLWRIKGRGTEEMMQYGQLQAIASSY